MDENGKAFEPVFGPGFTGLRNLGNRLVITKTLFIKANGAKVVIWRQRCRACLLLSLSR